MFQLTLRHGDAGKRNAYHCNHLWKRRLKVGLVVGKISPFVGKDEEIGPVVRIDPVGGIGLFRGTGPVVSLTY